MLRGVIFGWFYDDSNTRKLPGNYPDPVLKIKIYPDPTRTRSFGTRTRPGPVNFGLVHPLHTRNLLFFNLGDTEYWYTITNFSDVWLRHSGEKCSQESKFWQFFFRSQILRFLINNFKLQHKMFKHTHDRPFLCNICGFSTHTQSVMARVSLNSFFLSNLRSSYVLNF